jgi:precorrin-8X/cobalt-precorrin-8 methylmutase
MQWETMGPMDIEKRSFAIIDQLLGERKLPEDLEPIIKRVIHTSADLEYADSLYFSDGVTDILTEAVRGGAGIVTDTQMAKAGINKNALARFGGQVYCFVADEDVEAEAARRKTTRSAVAIEKAAGIKKPLIFAVGNAPTALFNIIKLKEKGLLVPAAVIGVPVGFVNVVESKERLIESGLPCIVARGRKGGSNIAAAICNAILYMAGGRDPAPPEGDVPKQGQKG